ncbi:MAG: hypothetical protein GTO12_26005 [Proteobacteria bacterium]|nr:hypothetical protein [Pseudomonadota bacterium]
MNPGQTWDYQGFTVWEGLKPGEADRWQYFFVVSKEGEKKFTYCVWADKETLVTKIKPEAGRDQDTVKKAVPLMREKGIDRVKEKIARGNFTNIVLKLEAEGSEEIELDALEEKLV